MPSPDIDRASSLCLSPPHGKMAGIFGEGATVLVLRTLAGPLLRGESVVAVDGGNRFDPYEIGKAARALGGDGGEALSRIRVSRAFTCHQMEALLSRRLPGALSRFDARFALVMGLPETFSDADVPYAEACRVFRNCLSALRRIARSGTRVVLVGRGEPAARNRHSVGPVPADRAGFFRYLLRTAEPVLLLRRSEAGWAWELRGAEPRLARGRP
ncbi:MAG: hypothetical protein C4529_14165 [Deltaproteobacteria bacterium]|nr:MAG: hypothetical protein C4529_14165 [Deltaproteobacteria bacterium]